MDLLACIRLFRRTVEVKSFSGVAREFGLTQPMVSKRIAWLEDELSVTLFRRSTRGIELTPEGQRLYLGAGPTLDELDGIIASIKQEKFHLTGELRLTASLAFAHLLIAPFLSEFQVKYPGLHLNFILSDGYVDLIGNNIDLAFRIGDLPDSSLKAIKVAQSHRKIYATKTFLKRYGPPKKLEDLEAMPKLFYSRLSDVPGWPLVDKNGKRFNYNFAPYLQSDGSELIRESMINSIGVALLPTWMIEGTKIENDVMSILTKHAPPPSPIYLITSQRRELTAKQRVVVEFFKAKFDHTVPVTLRP